mgnify:CR=1 FL=1
MSLATISIIVLVIAIAIGYFRNLNTGLVGLSLAMLFGTLVAGISAKKIIAFWPYSLCMTIMGITFLFAIAQKNGTLALVANYMTKLANGKAKLLPFVFFLLPGILGFVGVSGPVVLAIVAPVVMAIGRSNKIPDLDITISAVFGCLAGSLNSVNISGAIAKQLGTEAWAATKMSGVFDYDTIFLGCLAIFTFEFLVAYFIRGMYRFKDVVISEEKLELTTVHKLTIVITALALFSILVLKTDTGLTAFLAGTVLLLLKCGKQNDAIAGISWSTVILVGGMTMLIKVVGSVGGIQLIADKLGTVMTGNTAPSLLAVTASLMSSVSSASGVVMPSLIPTIPALMQAIGDAHFVPMLIGIVFGAHAVTISPMSTLGALCLASSSEEHKGRLFTQQLIIAVVASIATAVILYILCVAKIY